MDYGDIYLLYIFLDWNKCYHAKPLSVNNFSVVNSSILLSVLENFILTLI